MWFDRYPELTDIADRQFGVLGREQLRSRGWSRHRVDNEISKGRWTEVAPRVVAMQNAPLARDQLMWLGVLHAGPSAVLTHATACELARLRWTVDPTIHVLTKKSDDVARFADSGSTRPGGGTRTGYTGPPCRRGSRSNMPHCSPWNVTRTFAVPSGCLRRLSSRG